MANAKQSPVFETLCIIVDKHKSKDILNFLNKLGIALQLVMLGKGTAPSEISEIFNMENIEKEIITCLVPLESKKKVIKYLKDIFADGKIKGVAFTMPIKSATQDLVEIITRCIGGNAK